MNITDEFVYDITNYIERFKRCKNVEFERTNL